MPEKSGRPRRTLGSALVALGAAAAVLCGALVPVAGAAADSAPADPASVLTPETVTSDALPTPQIDGVVWDQVVVGNTVFVGGEFTTARPDGAAEGTNTVARSNFLAYDLTTGALITTIAPAFNAQVRSISASPDGTRLYVGGSFTKVGDVTRYRVAAFDLPSMTLVTNWAPTVNATVEAVAATNSAVYITGVFSSVQKNARLKGAALSPDRATILPWAPAIEGGTSRAIAISPDESKIVVAGSFTTLNGSNNPGLGMGAVTADTGASLPWKVNSTIRNGGTKSSIFDLSSDGDSVYGVGYQHSQGGQAIEGTFRASWADGTLQWLADCHGDSYSVEAAGDVIYTAGHAHACDNTGGFPNDPDVYHRAIAFTKQAAGTTVFNQPPPGWTYGNFSGTPATQLLTWFPDINTGTYTGSTQGAWDVTVAGDYVLYAGEFTQVNGRGQQGLVRFGPADIAPNDRGPILQSDAMTPTVTAFGGGAAKVTWAANFDDDNENLTYTVVRNGDTARPVYENTVASTFWKRPNITFVDDDLTPGASYTYRVRTEDPFGNATWGTSVTFVATDGDPMRVTDYDKTILSDLPSHYWPLNEASGATAADWTGSATQTFTGASVARGVAGAESDGSGAATRLGGDARTTSSPIEQLPNTFSVEAWFSTTSTTGGLLVGASNENGGNRDRLLFMGNDGRLHFGVYPGSVRMVDSDASYNDGAWHHVVVTLGSAGQQMYVDGVLVDSRTDTVSAQNYAGYWAIGGYSLAGWPDRPSTDYFSGSVDNVATYRTQLTPGQVAAHTAAVGGPDVEPVNVAPVASFSSSVSDLSVSVDAGASSDEDGSIADYAWSFGDGESGSGVTASHTYAAAGSYVVELVVTDDDGASHSTSSTVEVTAPDTDPEPEPEPTTLAEDDFTRDATNAWGAATTGGLWTVAGGNTSFSVNGSAGVISAAAGNTRAARLLSLSETDIDATARFSPSVVATGGGSYYSVIARQIGSSSYSARVWVRSTGEVRLQILRGTVVLTSQLVEGVRLNAGDSLDLRVQISGTTPTTIDAKTWLSGTAEPADWQLGVEDSTEALQAAGSPGVSAYVSGSTTNGPVVYTLDRFVASTPGSTQVTEPTEPTEPAEPTVPTEPTEPTVPTEPTEPTVPTEPTEPTVPTEPTEPTVPTEPTEPGTPATPAVAADDFARTITGGWGAATTGGDWTTTGGAGNFSVGNGAGVIAANPGHTRTVMLSAVAAGSSVSRASFVLDQAPTGGGQFVTVVARQVGTERYVARVWAQANGVLQLQLQRNGSTLVLRNLTGISYTSGDTVDVAVEVATVDGVSTLSAKAWVTGASAEAPTEEPTDWQITATDSTPGLQGAGSTGFALYLSGSAASPVNLQVRSYSVVPLD